jgi:hypothetical protein
MQHMATKVLYLRIPEPLYDQIDQAAAAARRTLNAQATLLLERGLTNDDDDANPGPAEEVPAAGLA